MARAPRKSQFSVVLTDEERQRLETIARQYTSPYCDVIRAKIVLLAAEDLPNDVISSRISRRA
jgi:hypothetical protein